MLTTNRRTVRGQQKIVRIKRHELEHIFYCTLGILCLFMYMNMYIHHFFHASPVQQAFPHPLEADMTIQNRMSRKCECPSVLLKIVDPTVDGRGLCAWSCQNLDVMCETLRHQTMMKSPRNPTQLSCLLDMDSFTVPNIAFYVIMAPKPDAAVEFQFLHYLSVLSVHRFQRPTSIYVIGDVVPSGYWWNRTLHDVTYLRHVYWPRPHVTWDGRVNWVQHLADVVRLQLLIANGGIYLDTDTIVVGTLDPLRGHPVTMGVLDEGTGMGNAIVLARRGSPFLTAWYRSYLHYRRNSFNYNSMKVPLQLWRMRSDWVHLESEKFYRPNWLEAGKLFNSSGFAWQHRYAVHVWHRLGHVPQSPAQIRSLNSTLGEVLRYVYYGSSNLMLN